MATNKLQTSLNVGDEDEDELQFRDSFPGFSDAPILNDEEHAKLLPSYDEEQSEKVSFWEFKYYQNLFNVDTKQVIERMIWSAIPRPGGATYLHRFIRANPDLYGPFWICVTLVFTIAVSNNIAEYLYSLGMEKAIIYDYRKVTFTATTLFSYTFLLPLAIWGFLWYFESATQLTILEIICIYGYSLAIYIPISVLWIVKVFWLQVVLILLGFLLSTSVMILTFWPAVQETRRKISAVLLLVICLFHALLCFGFSVYFFQPQNVIEVNPSVTTPKILESSPTTLLSKGDNNIKPQVPSENLKSENLFLVKSQVNSLTNGERNTEHSNKTILLGISKNNNDTFTVALETPKYSNKQKKVQPILIPQSKTGRDVQNLIHKNEVDSVDIHSQKT